MLLSPGGRRACRVKYLHINISSLHEKNYYSIEIPQLFKKSSLITFYNINQSNHMSK